MTTACIIGASAGLGLALARALAKQGHNLFLVAQDARDLGAIAADLALTCSVNVRTAALDINTADPDELVRLACDPFGHIDHLLFVAGLSQANDAPGLADADVNRLLQTNFCAPVRIINAFIPHLLSRPKASVTGAGSVASIRARRRNVHYGAAKSGLEFYFSGLRHAFSDTPCRIQYYRLGYLDTQMTFGQRLLFPAAKPERVASDVVSSLGIDRVGTYLPGWWRFIAIALHGLPWRVFRRLDF